MESVQGPSKAFPPIQPPQNRSVDFVVHLLFLYMASSRQRRSLYGNCAWNPCVNFSANHNELSRTWHTKNNIHLSSDTLCLSFLIPECDDELMFHHIWQCTSNHFTASYGNRFRESLLICYFISLFLIESADHQNFWSKNDLNPLKRLHQYAPPNNSRNW